jgi:hypothetical protein
MRYLRLVILVSIFGVGLDTAAFAVCCPGGCVENGYGGCWVRGTNNSCIPTSPTSCAGSPGSSGGGSGGQSHVVYPPPLSHCPQSYPEPASRGARTNECVAALSGNAQFWPCWFEDDAGRAEDYRTGLSCQDRQKALANQCRDRCARFVATKTECYSNNEWWPFFFGDIGGTAFGFAQVEFCGPRLPTRNRGFENRPPGFQVPTPNRGFETRPPWFR